MAINLDAVPENSTVLIRGIISYSRIQSQIEGEELTRTNTRRKFPIEKPYTTITLHSVELLAKDPSNPTIAEQYVSEHCYESTNKQTSPGACYTAVNKGKYLPSVGVQTSDGFQQVYPTAELAAGQQVIVMLRVFPTRMHNGITFDAVLVCAPEIQYRGNGSGLIGAALAEHGIVWHPTSDAAAADSEPDPDQVANTLPLANAAARANIPVTQPVVEQPVAVPTGAAPIITGSGVVPIAAVPESNGIVYNEFDR